MQGRQTVFEVQGANNDENMIPKLYKYLIAVLVLSTIILVVQTLSNTYLGSKESTFPFLFSGGAPSDIGPLDCLRLIWGGHYFGDFQYLGDVNKIYL